MFIFTLPDTSHRLEKYFMLKLRKSIFFVPQFFAKVKWFFPNVQQSTLSVSLCLEKISEVGKSNDKQFSFIKVDFSQKLLLAASPKNYTNCA